MLQISVQNGYSLSIDPVKTVNEGVTLRVKCDQLFDQHTCRVDILTSHIPQYILVKKFYYSRRDTSGVCCKDMIFGTSSCEVTFFSEMVQGWMLIVGIFLKFSCGERGAC